MGIESSQYKSMMCQQDASSDGHDTSFRLHGHLISKDGVGLSRIRVLVIMGLFSSLFGCGKGDSGDQRFVTESAFRKNLVSQSRMTPQTLEQLRDYGVTDDSKLALEFFFYTDTAAKASALATLLSTEGYLVEHGPSASDETTLVVTGWTTRMRMDEKTVTAWTERMCRIGFEHDCQFDGWGTNPDQDNTELSGHKQETSGKPFPVELIEVTGGRFEGEPNNYTLTLTLAPFEVEGELHETEIVLDGIEIPDGSIDAVANKSFDFPVNPQDGYIDGSVYLFHVHNPVDVTRIIFGSPHDNRIPVELDLRFLFDFEGTGYTNAAGRLRAEVEHKS